MAESIQGGDVPLLSWRDIEACVLRPLRGLLKKGAANSDRLIIEGGNMQPLQALQGWDFAGGRPRVTSLRLGEPWAGIRNPFGVPAGCSPSMVRLRRFGKGFFNSARRGQTTIARGR